MKQILICSHDLRHITSADEAVKIVRLLCDKFEQVTGSKVDISNNRDDTTNPDGGIITISSVNL